MKGIVIRMNRQDEKNGFVDAFIYPDGRVNTVPKVDVQAETHLNHSLSQLLMIRHLIMYGWRLAPTRFWEEAEV